MQVTGVTFDSHEPQEAARFWADALGWEVTHGDDAGAVVSHPGAGAWRLGFMKVREQKTVKNRVHLDLHADDLDAEIAHLEALGASLAWEEEFPPEWPYRNVVLRDPEGNEFCVGDGESW